MFFMMSIRPNVDSEEAMADEYEYEREPTPVCPELCGNDPSLVSRACSQNCSVYTGNALRSPGLRNGLVQDSIAQESIQYSSAPDSSEAAAAIFQQVDGILRERVNTEIDFLKENIHKILCEQQMQFREAFELPGDFKPSRESTHVVPHLSYLDDTSSEEYQVIGESSSDSDCVRADCAESPHSRLRRYPRYSREIDETNANAAIEKQETGDRFECNSSVFGCHCSGNLSPASYSDTPMGDEERIMNYLVRLLTASSVISNALRRKEYAT